LEACTRLFGRKGTNDGIIFNLAAWISGQNPSQNRMRTAVLIPVPRLFIGSSGEALSFARKLANSLKPAVDAVVWPDIFKPADFTLEALSREVERADFALLLFTPVDALRMRKKALNAVRDNVVLEFGLFAGRLGRSATFYLIPKPVGKLRIPTDLSGLTAFTYDSGAFRRDPNKLIRRVAIDIKEHVRDVALGSGALSFSGEWQQTWHFIGSTNFKSKNTSTANVLHVGSRFRAIFPSGSSDYLVDGTVTDRLVTGTWRDAANGGVYYGSFQLAVLNNGNRLKGRWVGHRERVTKIATGLWEWERAK
jgi:predicted nucleotide-binding protein